MGDIIGGIIGGVGSAVAGKSQAKATQKAAELASQTARLGFDWLTNSPQVSGYLNTGSNANNALAELLGVPTGAATSPAAVTGQANTAPAATSPALPFDGFSNAAAGREAYGYNGPGAAPGVPAPPGPGAPASTPGGAASPGTNGAFQNYLNSTGYNFQLGEGMRAITGNSAVRGLLNSGSTLRASQQLGQNLASTGFQNYLNNLSGLAAGGLSAAGTIGGAGGQAGAAGASALYNGGVAAAGAKTSGLSGLIGGITQAGQGAANRYPNDLGFLGY